MSASSSLVLPCNPAAMENKFHQGATRSYPTVLNPFSGTQSFEWPAWLKGSFLLRNTANHTGLDTKGEPMAPGQ